MGLSQSIPAPTPVVSEKAYAYTPNFTAPDGIVDKIKGLGDVINYFNDNDTSSIENFIDSYNKGVTAKEQIELGPEIKGMMMTFHNQLLEVIDSQMVGATSSEKQNVLKSKLKDNKQLNDMLKMYYNQKLQDVETSVLNDEMVRGNKDISDTVKIILNNVKSLKVKYKFFEYKYIQLNVFMIVFIQYVYNSMSKFIVDVIAYNQTRDAIRQEMTQKIFKATQEIMGASDMVLKPSDAEAINKMIFNLQDKVRRDQQEITDLSSKLKNNSLSDLLNFVLTSDETLAAHIMEGVDKYKQKTSVGVPTTPTFAQRLPQPIQTKPIAQFQQPTFNTKNQNVKLTNATSAPAPIVVQQPQQQQQQQQFQKPPRPQYQNPNQTFQNKPVAPFPQPVPNVRTQNVKANVTAAPMQPNQNKPNGQPQPTITNAKPQNVRTNAGPSTSKDAPVAPTQTGGFFRDASLLPQPFFQLDK